MWVKASERLPHTGANFFARIGKSENRGYRMYFDGENFYSDHDQWDKGDFEYDTIEWYDESIPTIPLSDVTPLVEALEEALTMRYTPNVWEEEAATTLQQFKQKYKI